MANTTKPATKEVQLTIRKQIEALQAQMQSDQVMLAKDLAEFIASDETGDYVAKLMAFRERSIPNQTLDQQIAGAVNVLGQLGQIALQIHTALAAQPEQVQ